MSLIIIHYLSFSLLILFNGYLISSILNLNLQKNLFNSVMLGLVGTGFLANLINFFFPLNDLTISINFFIIIGYFILKKKYLTLNLKAIKINYIFLILISLSLLQIYGSGFSDDLHHYHAATITNSDNLKNIFGINFLHNHFGYSSIWLTLHSYLNFNNHLLQDIHILNSIIFSFILCYFFNEVINGDAKLKFIAIFLIFFFLAKYTRLKEFGIDRPAIIILCFLIFEYLKIIKLERYNYENLFFLSLISLFLISIKIIYFFSILIPIHIFYKIRKKSLFFKSNFFYILITLTFLFFSKNIVNSGCLIYPIEKLCFNKISWNSKSIAKKIYINTVASAKSFDKYQGELSKTLYIKKFNWVNTWLKRNINEIKDFIITILIIFVNVLFVFKNKKFQKDKNPFIFILLITNLVIFFLSPVLRYHHSLFLIFIIYIAHFISLEKINMKKFYLLFCLLIFFNFSKNILRQLDNNFTNNPIKHIKDIGWYQLPKEKNLGKLKYFNGWIGNYPIGNEDLDKNYYHRVILGYDFILNKNN